MSTDDELTRRINAKMARLAESRDNWTDYLSRADVGWLVFFVGSAVLLLVGLLSAMLSDPPKPVEVRLEDGTRCAYVQGYRSTSMTCEWGQRP